MSTIAAGPPAPPGEWVRFWQGLIVFPEICELGSQGDSVIPFGDVVRLGYGTGTRSNSSWCQARKSLSLIR